MKNTIKLLAILLIVGLLLTQTNLITNLFNPKTVYAVGDLTIDWGVGVGDVGPIFTVSNMTPGESQTRTVKISNGATTARPVGIRGIKSTETGNLAQAMDIVISQGGTDLYGGSSATGPKTLADFFTETTLPNFVHLGSLDPSASATYTITVTFRQDAGNEFQNKTLSFALAVGIAVDVPNACQSIKLKGQPIFGTGGNDRLKGTNNNDLIIALEGNDTVTGGNGNDCIIKTAGTGTIDGGNGNDVIVSGSGNDSLNGNNGNDTIFAGAGNDQLNGSTGNDVLNGEDGDDHIDGDVGNDTELGGTGNDTLIGGVGNDHLDGGNDTDSANGNLGKDTCSAETKTACEL